MSMQGLASGSQGALTRSAREKWARALRVQIIIRRSVTDQAHRYRVDRLVGYGLLHRKHYTVRTPRHLYLRCNLLNISRYWNKRLRYLPCQASLFICSERHCGLLVQLLTNARGFIYHESSSFAQTLGQLPELRLACKKKHPDTLQASESKTQLLKICRRLGSAGDKSKF